MQVLFAVVLIMVLSVATSPVQAVGTAASPTLTATPTDPEPGTLLDVAGAGFRVAPTTCALVGLDRTWPCSLTSQGAGGTLDLGAVDGLEPGEYPVRVCVPTCEQPRGGTAEGTLVVRVPDTGRVDVQGEFVTDPSTIDKQRADSDGTDDRPVPIGLGRARAVFGASAPTALRLAAAAETLTLSPSTATPWDRVVATAGGLPTPMSASDCELTWDGSPVEDTCTADGDGSLRGTLRVPARAASGAHVVRACVPSCSRPVDVEHSTRVFVQTVVVPTVTPTPTGSPSASASPTGPSPSQRPTTQPTPSGGTAGIAGSTPGATSSTAPDPVEVPRVIGAELDDADRLLRAVDLTVGRTTGSGRVFRQDPGPGESVPAGTQVHLELREGPPVPPVQVPDLEGLTVEEAQDVLGPLGLALDDPPPPNAVITEQTPPAGTEVEPATLVSVEAAVPPVPEPPSEPVPLAWLVVLAAAALLGGIAASRIRSRLRGGPGLSASVRPVVDPRPVVRTQVQVPVPRLPALHVMSRPDADPTVTTEVLR